MAHGEIYEEFVEKFKHKLTTDDCYTPNNIYQAIKDWVIKEYDVSEVEVVLRPFYPGGDYENYNYPDNCVVIDNPPFSIFSKIQKFYIDKNIKFFLFAPSLTLFSANVKGVTHIVVGARIVYENGAKVSTSFVTNLDTCKIRLCPELNELIKQVQKDKETNRVKYNYPINVITAATLGKYVNNGLDLKIYEKECCFIKGLKAQKEEKKKLYGDGFLISDTVANKFKINTDNVNVDKITWELSDEEEKIIERLNEASK